MRDDLLLCRNINNKPTNGVNNKLVINIFRPSLYFSIPIAVSKKVITR